MGVPFSKPKDNFVWEECAELRAIDDHFEKRAVPKPGRDNLLVATWNIANLGLTPRSAGAIALIARILRRFDFIALQELDIDLGDFERVIAATGRPYQYMMSDPAEDGERLAFVYLPERVRRGRLSGEVAFAPNDVPKLDVFVRHRSNREWRTTLYPDVRLQRIARTPYFSSFEAAGCFSPQRLRI